jgi:hypothetical protein
MNKKGVRSFQGFSKNVLFQKIFIPLEFNKNKRRTSTRIQNRAHNAENINLPLFVII